MVAIVQSATSIVLPGLARSAAAPLLPFGFGSPTTAQLLGLTHLLTHLTHLLTHPTHCAAAAAAAAGVPAHGTALCLLAE
jgi:hypothetical protein